MINMLKLYKLLIYNHRIDDMKLFELLPDKFFSILSSSNKEIYADCIFLIYKTLNPFMSFGIEKEIIVDILTDYFSDANDISFIDEEEVMSDARSKANFIIRKFEECGWLERETDSNYVEKINLYDYAITFIETMDKLINNERLEYQGYIYTIYSLLISEENMLTSIMLEQVFDNSRKLINSLKSLNSNIHHYIDKITKLKNVEEIMQLHFNDYETNIVDKSYHRLKTSDNVSKFRPEIINRLESISKDSDLVKTICNQYLDLDKASTFEESYNIITKNLSDTINSLNSIDSIIREIDYKHNMYLRASLVRVKFMLNTSKDLGGQIYTLLKYIVSYARTNKLDFNHDDLPEELNIFEIFPQSFIDELSLYTVTEGRKTFIPQRLDKVLSKKERNELIVEFNKKNSLRLNKKKIDEFILNQLGNKKVINASQLPLNTIDDFIKIMYVYVYGNSRFISYKIIRKYEVINFNGYKFNDFEIWRK